MNGKAYKTLYDGLRETGEIALHNRLADVQRPVEELEKLFLVAADISGDDSTRRYLGFLMWAVSDEAFIPLLKYDDEKQGYLPYTKEVSAAEKKAVVDQGAVAIEMYEHLEHTKGEKLTKTRAAIFEAAAKAWREEPDDAKADGFLNFLTSCELSDGELKAVLEIFRKVSDGGCSVRRLAQSICKLVKETPSCWPWPKGHEFKQDIARVFALAWSRNISHEDLASALSSTLPLYQSSAPAFELLTILAKDIATLDAQTQELKKFMAVGSWDEQVHGNLTFAFPGLSRIHMLIERRDMRDQNEEHANFERARKKIQEWKESLIVQKMTPPKVRLEFRAFRRYSDKPDLTREIEL